MSFVRPEIRDALQRWRGAILGGGLGLCGAYLYTASFGTVRIFGGLFALVGLFLIWDGIRRARFPATGEGPGIVDVDERRITYFGPTGGGAISLDELVEVTIETTGQGPTASDLFWRFLDRSGQRLVVPGDAAGADQLFDALAALKGADYEAVIAASGSVEPQVFTIWRRPVPRLH